MRVRDLRVHNLRAIENFEAKNLTDFILIAGPNGCGKTTVLDAIRLVKSVYVLDEWKRWFNEFGINVDRITRWESLFRNPSKEILISAKFELASAERSFLKKNARSIALAIALYSAPERRGSATVTGDPPVIPPTLTSSERSRITTSANTLAKAILEGVRKTPFFQAEVRLREGPEIKVTPSAVATAVFTCFRPDVLGEVEFHTSRRNYARDTAENVQLKLGSRSEERRSRFLYDLENKYKNIKTQLGEEYIASILKRTDPDAAPLQRSVKELFSTFFPGKSFLGVGVNPDHSLRFPVKLETGEVHDIDELSSGEKEIVYGYLWLRTSTPPRSVVLVDEPELHLNPALVHGLPAFYQRHLAEALSAQVWIVTHSDAILRQAVRSPTMSVFHMARPVGDGRQQALRIGSQDTIEAAVIDLIGDLAAYRPFARIVLVEGQKDTRFDVDVVRRLFPDYAERANLIPVGSRRMTGGVRVRLVEILQESGLSGRVVSITDGDLGLGQEVKEQGSFTWPVYEIENFLLAPRVLRAAVDALLRKDPFGTDGKVEAELKRLARPLVDELALIEVQHVLNAEFVNCIKVGAASKAALKGLIASSSASKARVATLDASEARVQALLKKAAREMQAYLASSKFLERFPGDRLLRAFAGSLGIDGDHFRNVLLDQAQRLGLRPKGMESTLRAALE